MAEPQKMKNTLISMTDKRLLSTFKLLSSKIKPDDKWHKITLSVWIQKPVNK